MARRGPSALPLRLALLAGAALPMQVAAQTQATAPAAAPRADVPQPTGSTAQAQPPSDNEIIVTAQRRAERLEAVPVSITAVSGATLARAGVQRIQDLGQIATGAQVNRAGGFTQPSIRGITTLTTGLGFENNVAVYVDGFYQADTIAINVDLVNLNSVQVLKGPQGTLYGRNATGGAIVLETLAPSERFTGNAQVSYGRFDDKRVQGYLSGPIADDLLFSVAGYYRRSDGYIRDLGTDPASKADDFDAAPLKNESLRSKLLWKATDTLSITLAHNYAFVLDARGLVYTVDRYASPILPQPPARATRRDTATNNARADNGGKVHEFTGKVQLDTDIGTLTSYTGYAERTTDLGFDFDASKAQITYARSDNVKQYTYQQAVDFAIDAIDGLDIVTGVFVYRDKFRQLGAQVIAGGVTLRRQFNRADAEAMAVYIDGTWHITDKLFLTGGARYNDERKRFRYNEVAAVPGGAVAPPADKNASFTQVTPRAVLRYELADRTNVYASYTQGFRSGAFNPVPQPDPRLVVPVRPEKIAAYEIGFKTASPAFRFDAAAYYYDFKDLQVGLTIPNPLTPTSVIQQAINAEKAEVYGAEASAGYTPVPALNLRAGISWVHARYKDFRNATGTGLNAAGTGNVTGQAQDWTGQQMARAPSITANAGFDFTTDLAGGSLAVSGNGSYSASYVVSNPSLFGPLAGPLANRQRYRQGAFALFNAQLNWTDPSDTFTIGVYGDNVTNTRYRIVKAGGAFGDYSVFNEPASYGVRAGVKF